MDLLIMDETLLEEIIIYSSVILFCLVIVFVYLRKQKRESKKVEEKIVSMFRPE